MIKYPKKTLYIVSSILVLIGFILVIVYGFSFQDPVSRSFKKIFPAAIVGGQPVSVYNWDENRALAKRTDPSGDLNTAERVYITQKKKQALVSKLGIPVSSSDVAAEFRFDQTEFQDAFSQFIDEYFLGNEKMFIEHVVFPQYFDAQLRIKYNSNKELNQSTWTKAEGLLARINRGEPFDEVARLSDDKISGSFGGDLGIVNETEILPELMNVLKTLRLGEVHKQIVVSRYGYHILYPVETAEENGQKIWHLKHIFIETEGYENWVDDQLNQISVWRIK